MQNKLFYISPIFLVLYNFLIMMIALLFPPTIYTYFLDEKNYIFMNLSIFLLVTMSLLAFWLGYEISYMTFPKIKCISKRKIFIKKSIFIGIPLIIFEILTALFIVVFIKQNIGVFYLLLNGLGNSYKENILTNFFFLFVYMLIGIIYWAYNKYKRFTIKSNLIRILIFIGILEVLLVSSIMLARFIAIPFLIGLVIIFLKYKKKFNLFTILKYLILGIIVFIIASIFRSNNSDNIFELIITKFMGYTIASFNRLALVLDGNLNYTYSYTGYYLMPLLSHVPLLHNIIPNIYQIDYKKIWLEEFKDVESTQLQASYIWSTVYGYIYSVLGYLTPIYFFMLGLLTGPLWKSFVYNKTTGTIIYPWFFAGLILSFTSNIIFLPQFIALLYALLFIILWESLFTSGTNHACN